LARLIVLLPLAALLVAGCGDSEGGAEGNFVVREAHPVGTPHVQTVRASSGAPVRYFESDSMDLDASGSADLALQCPDGLVAFDGYLAGADPGVVMGYNGPRPDDPAIWQYGLTNLRGQPAAYATGVVCERKG
jgi:hypothetical protein